MTFKHINFDESAVMRSLARVARDKGWLKEAQVKQAPDIQNNEINDKLIFSANLTENILKLSSGLRDIGLGTYADEIENNFMQYKKAQTLYETSKETGDDVVDFAHPDGSKKISDVAGDAVFETILDQHLAMVKMVGKKPTGKLASNVINEVKTALGSMKKTAQPSQTQVEVYSNILTSASDMLLNIATKLESVTEDQVGVNWESPQSVANSLKRMSSILNSTVKPEVSSGITKSLWVIIKNIKAIKDKAQVFNDKNNDANTIVNGMIGFVQAKLEQVSWSLEHPEYTPEVEQYSGSTFSKTQEGYHWQEKYKLPQVQEVDTPVSSTEVRNLLEGYFNQIKRNVLDKEVAIYKPVPQTDVNKMSVLNQAFTRAKNLNNQLYQFSNLLKTKDKISFKEINQLVSGLPYFTNKVFTNKNALADYIAKVQKTIYDAVGIK